MQGFLKEDSIIDVFYADHERIGLYLSQFNKLGALKSLVSSDEKSKSKDAKLNIFSIAEGGTASARSDSATRTFDPLWTQCLNFLDELHTRSMINHDIKKSIMGQIVLCHGHLVMLEVGILQKLFLRPTFREITKVGAKAIPGNENLTDAELEAELDIFADLPHTVQAQLFTDKGHLWCTLNPQYLVTTPFDIMLKYGVLVDGDWHMLAVMDAFPSDNADLNKLLLEFSPEKHLIRASLGFFPLIRKSMGRPSNHFGATPLLIYRHIN